MSADGLERIAAAFAASGKRSALMPYLMGGYPDLERSLAIGEACIAGGADLLELGVPFSDPLADGPTIHAAATAALAAGTSVSDVLELAARLTERIALVVMTYANTVLTPGIESFLDQLADGGVSGLIVPDLPFEESDELERAADQRGLALIALVAPTTTDARLREIGRRARGFLYVVSVTGTTGERSAAPASLAPLIERAKSSTDVPVALGFGISTPEQAAAAADAGADGVIVGSRIVRAAGEPGDSAGAVEKLVSEFATALTAPVA
ncbi:MAG TPA: tryptophan synthase subunit alpha [Solirubrobacteraceae bacterium]|nr:tryptophan synthase subunit alpha [Solirubrobacteraceae bacterium]